MLPIMIKSCKETNDMYYGKERCMKWRNTTFFYIEHSSHLNKSKKLLLSKY